MTYDPADDMRDEWAEIQFRAMVEDVVDGEHVIDYLLRQDASMNLVPASAVVVACPTCYGGGVVGFGGNDPQTHVSYDCPTCSGVGHFSVEEWEDVQYDRAALDDGS